MNILDGFEWITRLGEYRADSLVLKLVRIPKLKIYKTMCNQVYDCPLSETSSGGEDEDVCEASAAGFD